ncbi:hypothetical protein [Kineococcus sp. SYSU DK005]|uniref:hypothetical protein n=1 Tax=Kineococcus sp. SYSU DK005 TaxID=3383126 RepID=UPI003D7E8793
MAFRTRKAITITATSFATLTLIPWAFEATRTQRVLLVAGAVPIAVLFGAIAGWTPPAPPRAGTGTPPAGATGSTAAAAAAARAAAPSPAPTAPGGPPGAPAAGTDPATGAPAPTTAPAPGPATRPRRQRT